MKIGFVGAGCVGVSLGKYFTINNIEVVGYYSAVYEDALWASKFTNTECFKSINEIIGLCDTLFLTVNDDAIENVAGELSKLKVNNKILIHTSGAKSSEIFGDLNNTNYCYSVHPIYAFNDKSSSYMNLKSAAFAIEGSREMLKEIEGLFKSLGNKVAVIDRSNKARYHAACVMMSNMVTGLIYEAFSNLESIGISDTKLFNPLILNNIQNVQAVGPVKALTGPVIRNDISTIEGHLKSLDENDEALYKKLSLILIEIAEKRNSNDYSKLKMLLEEEV